MTEDLLPAKDQLNLLVPEVWLSLQSHRLLRLRLRLESKLVEVEHLLTVTCELDFAVGYSLAFFIDRCGLLIRCLLLFKHGNLHIVFIDECAQCINLLIQQMRGRKRCFR